MATGQWPTLQDVASRVDKDGKQKYIAEMLSKCNDVWDDLMFKEASEIGGHDFAFRTSLPGGYWTSYNQGVPVGKSTTNQGRVGLGRLEGFSQIDMRLADDTTDSAAFRLSEDVAFMEGMSQTMTEAIFYGSTTSNPFEFVGFSSFYNTVNTSVQPNALNVIDGGGTGSSNASVWLLGWGDKTIFGLYPRGSDSAGLKMEDLGNTVMGYDSVGNMFRAYTTHFKHTMGICPMDWRFGARMCNIDTTSAGLKGPNAVDLFANMSDMVLMMPTGSKATSGITKTDAPDDPSPGTRQVFYCDRLVRSAMDKQAIRDRNVLISMHDYAGIPIMGYRTIPIKVVDQLINNEARVV